MHRCTKDSNCNGNMCWSFCRIHNLSTVECQYRERIGYGAKIHPPQVRAKKYKMTICRTTASPVPPCVLWCHYCHLRGAVAEETTLQGVSYTVVSWASVHLSTGYVTSNSMQINPATVWYGVLKHFHIHHLFLYAGRSTKERRGLLPSARTLSDSSTPQELDEIGHSHSHGYVNRKLLSSIRLQAVCGRTGTGKGKFLNRWVIQGLLTTPGCWGRVECSNVALHPPQGYFLAGDDGYSCISHPIALITLYSEQVQPQPRWGQLSNWTYVGHFKNPLAVSSVQGSGGEPQLCIHSHHCPCCPSQHLPDSRGYPQTSAGPWQPPCASSTCSEVESSTPAGQLSAPVVRIAASQEHDYWIVFLFIVCMHLFRALPLFYGVCVNCMVVYLIFFVFIKLIYWSYLWICIPHKTPWCLLCWCILYIYLLLCIEKAASDKLPLLVLIKLLKFIPSDSGGIK